MFTRCLGEIRKERYFYQPGDKPVPPPPAAEEQGKEQEKKEEKEEGTRVGAGAGKAEGTGAREGEGHGEQGGALKVGEGDGAEVLLHVEEKEVAAAGKGDAAGKAAAETAEPTAAGDAGRADGAEPDRVAVAAVAEEETATVTA